MVVDWDAALIIDEPQNFDETLYVMELANLQLAELEAYDRMLDDALERAYRDLSRTADPRARGTSCGSCARSASTWPASATSCPTSPSSSATGTWRASTRTSPRASTWRLAPHHRRQAPDAWTTYTSCSTTTRPTAGC